MSKMSVKTISLASVVATVVLSALCIIIFVLGRAQFAVLQDASELFIACENDTNQLQDGSDYLTEQVRLAAMTGEAKYIDAYFTEANSTKSRDTALADLESRFGADNEALNALRGAMSASINLMDTEYLSMRFVCEAKGIEPSTWPEELKGVDLTAEQKALSSDKKLHLAQELVSNEDYQNARNEIISKTKECTNQLISATQRSEGRAATVFKDIYFKLEICVAVLAVITLSMSILVWVAIIKPLVRFRKSIKKNEKFPVVGASELQTLAETYNRVYDENEATQHLIKHQAEHDALTGLLNRGSYDRILGLYDKGDEPFALILADVDVFKSVNDTFGHAEGDRILKRVAHLLETAFRDIDHICRIGGDEFAIVMVKMTSDLRYTIEEKIDFVNEQLQNPHDGLPKVSLSVGIAFSDRANPGESIFKDADKALYHTKDNGRCGYTFYGDF